MNIDLVCLTKSIKGDNLKKSDVKKKSNDLFETVMFFENVRDQFSDKIDAMSSKI